MRHDYGAVVLVELLSRFRSNFETLITLPVLRGGEWGEGGGASVGYTGFYVNFGPAEGAGLVLLPLPHWLILQA